MRARSMPTAEPLPPDVRVMNALSLMFCAAFVVMVLSLLVAWLMRQPVFGLSAIEVQGDVEHNNAVSLRTNVAPRLTGNFFTIDLGQARSVFESVPWVRQAVVQRQFPNRLKVVLQEHQPIAYWGEYGDTRLVNSFGEVFEASQDDMDVPDLPTLNGPVGQAPLVLQVYRALAPLFIDSLDAVLDGLELSGQGGWRARLDSGAVMELGHGSPEEVQGRTKRFLSTLPLVSAKHGRDAGQYGRDFETADLRYPNGYAIRLKGVTTGNASGKEDKKAKR